MEPLKSGDADDLALSRRFTIDPHVAPKKYETTKTEIVYQSPRTTMEQNQVTITESGSQSHHTWDVVRTKDAVAVLPINDKGNLLLLENYRYPVGRRLIELCAGLIENGEDPLEAIHREMGEELGKKALYVIKLAEFYSSPGLMTEKIHLYQATGLSDTQQKLDAMEDLRVIEVKHSDVMRMLRNGEIQDGKTLLALTLYASISTVTGGV